MAATLPPMPDFEKHRGRRSQIRGSAHVDLGLDRQSRVQLGEQRESLHLPAHDPAKDGSDVGGYRICDTQYNAGAARPHSAFGENADQGPNSREATQRTDRTIQQIHAHTQRVQSLHVQCQQSRRDHSHAFDPDCRNARSNCIWVTFRPMDEARLKEMTEAIQGLKQLNRDIWNFMPRLEQHLESSRAAGGIFVERSIRSKGRESRQSKIEFRFDRRVETNSDHRDFKIVARSITTSCLEHICHNFSANYVI